MADEKKPTDEETPDTEAAVEETPADDTDAAVEPVADEEMAEAAEDAVAAADEADAPKAEADAEAEEKPKPKRARKKKDADAAAEGDDKTEAKAKKADKKDKDEKADEKQKRRSRGGAATAGASRRAPRREREPGEEIIVRAKARYVRCAPRKARLVVDHIRGKSVDEARAILIHTPRAASRDVLKLLDSAIANAENNHELVADELKIHQAFVDEGPTLKRFRPRALGRAARIRKRTSHMTILLTPKE
jgi:ribosomal protein L22